MCIMDFEFDFKLIIYIYTYIHNFFSNFYMSNFMSNFIDKILVVELYSNFKVIELEIEHEPGDLSKGSI